MKTYMATVTRRTGEQEDFIPRAMANGIALHVIEQYLDDEDNRENQKGES